MQTLDIARYERLRTGLFRRFLDSLSHRILADPIFNWTWISARGSDLHPARGRNHKFRGAILAAAEVDIFGKCPHKLRNGRYKVSFSYTKISSVLLLVGQAAPSNHSSVLITGDPSVGIVRSFGGGVCAKWRCKEATQRLWLR